MRLCAPSGGAEPPTCIPRCQDAVQQPRRRPRPSSPTATPAVQRCRPSSRGVEPPSCIHSAGPDQAVLRQPQQSSVATRRPEGSSRRAAYTDAGTPFSSVAAQPWTWTPLTSSVRTSPLLRHILVFSVHVQQFFHLT
jgi:hypothetical protein